MGINDRFFALLLFFFLAGSAFFLSAYKPFHNWDIIGYIASAKSFELQDNESLHRFTYGHLRDSLSAIKYETLTENKKKRGYRYSISTNPSALKEQLPF